MLFGWLLKKHWRNSAAHLLLLSKFRKGDSLDRYRSDSGYWAVPGWTAALGERPTKAIKRFIKDGMVEPGGLQQRMEYQFKASTLKSMLKEKGLKISGRKEDLIRRLIDSDARLMSEITRGLDLYCCTAAGMQLAENYLEGEKVKRQAVEQEVLGLLVSRKFSKALHAVSQYEAAQVFSRGLGIDWANYDGREEIKRLKFIFRATPTILDGIEKERLKQLRCYAGMMLLWGTATARRWSPKGFETGIHLDADAVCRMLEFHSRYLHDMDVYRKDGIRTVKVCGADDGAMCSECRKISGRKYHIGSVPELPYAKCTCDAGCRCLITAEYQ